MPDMRSIASFSRMDAPPSSPEQACIDTKRTLEERNLLQYMRVYRHLICCYQLDGAVCQSVVSFD